jgi:hypothetical protein
MLESDLSSAAVVAIADTDSIFQINERLANPVTRTVKYPPTCHLP